MNLYDQSNATVAALLAAIEGMAKRAKEAADVDAALSYAAAARNFGDTLAAHSQWNRPASAR